MISRRLSTVRTALLTVACIALAAPPVWAGSSQCCKKCCCYCQGIDRCGCLSNCGGCTETCSLVLNTKTCKFTGCCRCKVQNCCRKSECYKNICFLQDPSYCCTSSCYTCQPCGSCCYTVCGCCSGGGAA